MDPKEKVMNDEHSILKSSHHPLLIENVMTEIFSYFENDASNLRQFRLVCPAWNCAAAPVIKRSLVWKIRPGNHERSSKEFEKIMHNSNQDVLRNFQLLGKGRLQMDEEEDWDDLSPSPTTAAPALFSLFGDQIGELRLEDDDYLYDLVRTQETLSNLQVLDLSMKRKDVMTPPCTSWKQLLNTWLPKLKSLVLRFDQEGIIFTEPVLKDLPPTLESLTVYEWRRMLRGFEEANLMSLKSLKLYHDDDGPSIDLPRLGRVTLHSLTERDMEVLKQCKNLKSLALSWNPNTDYNIRPLLQALAPRLMELEIIHAIPSEERQIGNPVANFPLLKVLRLDNLYTDYHCLDNFDTPILNRLDLHCYWPRTLSVFGPVGVLSFPQSLKELRIEVSDDDDEPETDNVLRRIFSRLPTLQRLHLGSTRVTDSGITGIPTEDLKVLPPAAASAENAGIDVGAMRQFPFIGDLKQLQHFTFDGHTLSNKSIHYGFRHLSELTYFKLPPYYDSGPGYVAIERVDAPALVDACPALVRIDVNGFPDFSYDAYDDNIEYISIHGGSGNGNGAKPCGRIYRGCGLRDDEIGRIRAKNPWLEIVHREKYSISERERAARRGPCIARVKTL